MVIILLLSLVDNGKKYMRFSGHFDDHADALVQCGAHCPMDYNQGFTQLLAPYCPGESAMDIDGGDTTNIQKIF